MAINPTADKYIEDLLASNHEDFGAINHFFKEIKELRRKRYALECLGKIDTGILYEISEYTSKIVVYYHEIQHCRECIRGRLEEINHVKEVAKHGA